MKQRLIVAGIFVPLIFIILVFLPGYVLAGLVAVICAIAAYELLHAIAPADNERICIYATFSAAVIPVGVYLGHGALVFQAALFVMMALTFFEAVLAYKTRREMSFSHVLIAMFGGAIVPYLLSCLISLRELPGGKMLVLMPFIAAFVTDGGAYFAGVFFGKRKAIPNVSPNKTVEGYIGGIVAGVMIMLLYGVVIVYATQHYVRFWALLLYGVAGGAMTELGDLAFSFIKREYNVKDYGSLLPGHGGMLDRFDSMVFAAPAIYLLVSIIPAVVVR